MPQAKILNEDLYIIFNEEQNDTLVSYKMDNGVEIDFKDDELVQIILPNIKTHLQRQLGTNIISNIIFQNITFDNETMLITLGINGSVRKINVNCSSIISKL